MVYINDQKYACVSCIKGHRSSSCSHSDRPLVAIKKKGRPVSQCERCRELRKTKKIHVKCTCEETRGSPTVGQAAGQTKKGKKRPTTPTLPAGLRDYVPSVHTQGPPLPPHPKQRVDSLLNPCACKSARSCKCNPPAASYGATASTENGAEVSCCRRASALRSLPFSNRGTDNGRLKPYARQKPANTTSHDEQPTMETDEDYTLAPLRIQLVNDPLRPVLPGVESICTCGPSCACLGCREHRGAAATGEDCPDGCDHCVDHRLLALPVSSSLSSFTPPPQHAPLPPPPRAHLRQGIQLDPTNVTVYPSSVLSNAKAARAVGLVKLPPLVCCGGQCSCPADACGCGANCIGSSGCAASHRVPQKSAVLGSCCDAVASLPSPPAEVDSDVDAEGEPEVFSPRPVFGAIGEVGEVEDVDIRMASPAPSTSSSLQTAPGSPDPDYFAVTSCCA